MRNAWVRVVSVCARASCFAALRVSPSEFPADFCSSVAALACQHLTCRPYLPTFFALYSPPMAEHGVAHAKRAARKAENA